MNKRQAKFIMQLPDGYEWMFFGEYKNYLIGANPILGILVYQIINDELIPMPILEKPK